MNENERFIEVEYKLTNKEKRKFMWFLWIKIYKGIPLIPALAIAIATIVFLIKRSISSIDIGTSTVGAEIESYVVTSVVLILCIIFVLRSTKKENNSGKVMHSYRFGQDAIEMRALSDVASSQVTLKYSGIKEVYETKDNFYLMLTSSQGHAIVKNALNDSDLDALRALLTRKIGKIK
jgi:hypothetical protein